VKFLSEEFLAAWAEADRDPLGEATAVIAVKTEGGPDGKVAVTLELDEGAVTGARPGAQKGADLELTIPYDLAVDLLQGDADPAVEFMRGALKVSGDMGAWLEILPAWRQRSAPSSVAAATEF